jgi:hypothetical protein
MDDYQVFVLTRLVLDGEGQVKNKIAGVTFDVLEAESYRDKDVTNDFETFTVLGDWREGAEQTNLIASMRDFRAIVRSLQDQALR